MGYRITVNVYNYTNDTLNLSNENGGNGHKIYNGKMENLKESLPSNQSTAAFTRWAGSGTIKGWGQLWPPQFRLR